MILESTGDAVAIAREGLFFSIAAEAEDCLPGKEIRLLIGEDGARRIVEWDYGLEAGEHIDYLETNLRRYPVLTARRREAWEVPERLAPYLGWLEVKAELEAVSSTEVRQRIAADGDWEELVPEAIRTHVRRLYGCSGGRVKGQ